MIRVPVEAVVPISEAITAAERDAILEIGYLTIVADREVRAEELDALERIAERLTRAGGAPDPARTSESISHPARALDARFSMFAQGRERDGAEARLLAAASVLSRASLRTLAYRVACALSLVDLDIDDREFELDLALIDALRLDQATADQLADAVRKQLVPGA